MKRMKQWIGRATAALTGAILAVMLPVAAWAQATPGVKEVAEVGGVLAKYRPSRGGGGSIGLIGGGIICCLIVVVGIIVLVVFLVKRNK